MLYLCSQLSIHAHCLVPSERRRFEIEMQQRHFGPRVLLEVMRVLNVMAAALHHAGSLNGLAVCIECSKLSSI